jgi:hypothetical protein
MQLIQFVNKNDEAVEQGDVVVISRKQAQLFHGLHREIYPEVDLTDADYDTRVCGVVAELYADIKVEEITREGEEEQAVATAAAGQEEEDAGARQSAKPKRGEKTAKRAQAEKNEPAAQAESAPPQVFSQEEFDALDRTRIGPGQRGFMVVLGTYGHCKVDADIAPVSVGDVLTTSPTKGHAQKVLDPSKATGAVIGKALGSLKKGKGTIPVIVTLQ